MFPSTRHVYKASPKYNII